MDKHTLLVWTPTKIAVIRLNGFSSAESAINAGVAHAQRSPIRWQFGGEGHGHAAFEGFPPVTTDGLHWRGAKEKAPSEGDPTPELEVHESPAIEVFDEAEVDPEVFDAGEEDPETSD